MFHPLLQRQLKKYPVDTPESLQKLLGAISNSYNNYEKDKELSEHAFALTEKDYIRINTKLQDEVESRNRAYYKLIDAINTFEEGDGEKFTNNSSLGEIIDYLKKLIIAGHKTQDELIKAKEFAEKAAMARSEFLSMMSHEIRTPLNAVVGTTYLLMQDKPMSHQEKYLNILKFAAETLMLLINDILDFNKIEAGKIDIEQRTFNLTKLLTQVKNSSLKRAEEKGTRLRLMADTDLPTFVIGDSLRLGQILNNLVSNAVKFTKDGTVTIEAHLTKKDEKQVSILFSVQDTGIGIAPEDQEKIFDKFIQASESTTREFGGTGLGLAITTKLLELMDSKMQLQSELNKGSKFSFELCMGYTHDVAEQKEEEANIDMFDLKGVRILLVEDNEMNHIIASTLLGNWKAEVDVAINGEDAIEHALKNEYDVVLMDLHMPIMNGYAATEAILKVKPNLPILALTASAMMNIKDKAFVVGMKDYITKPFNPNELFEKIKKYASS